MKTKHIIISILAVLFVFPLTGMFAQQAPNSISINVITTFEYPGTVISTQPQKINDGGDIVGTSLSATFSETAVIWEKGANKPANLNSLVVDNPSGLFLALAVSINSRGEIVGLAFTSSMEPHGYLATPVQSKSDSESAAPSRAEQ